MTMTANSLTQITNDDGTIDDETFVDIVNVGTHPIIMDYARKRYICNPGERITVKYHCMVLYFGDPRAFDVPGDDQRRFRTDEWLRLRVLYGIYEHDYKTAAEWGGRIPQAEVYNQYGNRIETVLDNPEATPKNSAVYESDYDRFERQLSALQSQIERLEKERDKSIAIAQGNNPSASAQQIIDENQRTTEVTNGPIERPSRTTTRK